jgi:DNA-binding SARP family transcriptional activator
MAVKRPVSAAGEHADVVRPADTAPPAVPGLTRPESLIAVPIVSGDAPGNGVSGHGDGEQGRRSGRRPRVVIAPVVRSKVQPPPLRLSTLSRQRLIDRLAAATQNRVTLIVADAGYGKTTLLADFSRRFDGACIWYSLESSDGDWFTILNHLLAAAREVRPEFGPATAALLRSEPGMPAPKDAATASLLQEFHSFADERAVIVLDDVHNIEGSRDGSELILRLLRDAPRSFSFVLTSRHRPSLGLARWAGMGELVELTTDDLRFSPEETARLFGDSFGQPLEPAVLREIDTRLRGWAACLQLFSTLISGFSPSAIRAATESLSGSTGPLYDYLAQEVVANLPPELQAFLTRASILQLATPERLQALFPAEPADKVDEWAAESDALGLLSRVSQSGSGRQFHPLLRDFLQAELRRRHSPAVVGEMHAAVARASENDPLAACHHYIEAGLMGEAMRCLGTSTLQTMGSGRWGTAAQLATRLEGQPHSAAVAAIQGRRLLDDGELSAAAALFQTIDVAHEPDPVVRAVLRHTLLSLAWRTGSGEDLLATLGEILGDPDTPSLLRDIAQVFMDASPMSSRSVTLHDLAGRLTEMAHSQQSSGFGYYAAISLHNAGICELFAGRPERAVSLGHKAIAAFDGLTIRPPEVYSVHAQLAAVSFEIGERDTAEEYIRVSQSSGAEHADVPAELAYNLAVLGERSRAARALLSVEELERRGLSDLPAMTTATLARAFLMLPANPSGALEVLDGLPPDFPLDLGYGARRYLLRSLCHLLSKDRARAVEIADRGRQLTVELGNRRYEVRLALVVALAKRDADAICQLVRSASQASEMALLEVGDAIGMNLDLAQPAMDTLEQSISQWPLRWQAVLRRQLDHGDDPRSRIAATMLDKYGAVEDVGLLRAYEKTYRRRGVPTGLGRNLARRVSPRLQIHDLGQVSLEIDGRTIELARTRRKPAALLMYLVTRPNLTATREQVIEELWPEADSVTGMNSLNQSLYFLRREVDPWFEDDLRPGYLAYQAELISIDQELARIDSAEFLTASRELTVRTASTNDIMTLLKSYRGQFCPEFEYEEWAISWRARVHAAYLDFARSAVVALASVRDWRTACDVALHVLGVDPSADDIERRLIWLYWRAGAKSAAEAQYRHLAGLEKADGMEPTPFQELVSAATLE